MAKKKSSGGIWETLRVIAYAVLIALFIRTFAFEPFNIPSGSMVPTLLVGDYLFVSKFSYGYSRYSIPLGLPIFSGRVIASLPEQGDVAVFKLPRDNSTDYIKRIIGLPGDRIQVIDGILHINGTAVERQRIQDYNPPSGVGARGPLHQYIEVLPNGRAHLIIEESDAAAFDNTSEFLVPEDHFFVMGDNRDNSLDSRFQNGVGFVPFENLVGRAEIIFFSTNGDARLWEIWKWPWAIRYSRIFDLIN
ncbi:MAG: signal peptidase I [Alphaproteobacteria bacterium]|nr:signal peptidase I [Alphaproteobacteria bacterium]